MVVVLVIGVLAAVAVPTFLLARARSADRLAQANLMLATRAAGAGIGAGLAPTALDAGVIAGESGVHTVAGDEPSSGPDVVSVHADTVAWSAASKGDGGVCWWTAVDRVGLVRFGSSTAAWACTGASATAASATGFDAAAGRPGLALVSAATDGGSADGASAGAVPSADGRYVAFESAATNLVPGDVNGYGDVFVRDLASGTTTVVSVSSAGVQGNRTSATPGISADGRYVAFRSTATNLVEGDTNGVEDVFVHDRLSGATTRVNVGPGGVQANAASPPSVVIASLSPSGRYVQFRSTASNLVVGDTNGVADVFVHDRDTSTTVRVSVSSSGAQLATASGNSVQAGDRFVRFTTADAAVVPGDANGFSDVFAYDLSDGSVTRLSGPVAGQEPDASSTSGLQSADGSVWTFQSAATNLDPADTVPVVDVFVRSAGTARLLSRTVGGTGVDLPASDHWLAADASRAVFVSSSSLLSAGDPGGPDVFDVQLSTGEVNRIDLTFGADELDGLVRVPRLDGSGTVMTLLSTATNHLASADGNGAVEDVFVLVR